MSSGSLILLKIVSESIFREDLFLYNRLQIGVVSFGTSKCAKNKPGVYTRVVEFLGWMESVMRE